MYFPSRDSLDFVFQGGLKASDVPENLFVSLII